MSDIIEDYEKYGLILSQGTGTRKTQWNIEMDSHGDLYQLVLCCRYKAVSGLQKQRAWVANQYYGAPKK